LRTWLLDVTYITLQPSGKTPEDVQRALDAVAKAAHTIGGALKTEHDALLALLLPDPVDDPQIVLTLSLAARSLSQRTPQAGR